MDTVGDLIFPLGSLKVPTEEGGAQFTGNKALLIFEPATVVRLAFSFPVI